MAKQLQIRGGTTVQHSTFTGALREITIDTDKDVVVVHDGTTVGGFPLAKQTSVDSKVTKVTSTDNAVVRFDGTTGQVQNSGVIIDDSSNVGIGVTPSAWGSVFRSIEGGNSSSSQNWIGLQTNDSTLKAGTNSYYDGSYYRYKFNNAASMQDMFQGGFQWSFAPSGTAGNAITWTNAMTLNNNGNLLVGTSTDDGKHKVQVNGKIASTLTDNYATSHQTKFDDSGVSTASQNVPAFSASFSPMLGGATFLSGFGYTSHNIVGAWRSGYYGWNTGEIGTYITPGGGSDFYSNSYYLLKDNGQIGWSGGTPTLVSLSDMRKKDKKEDLVNGLEKINSLTPFIGRYKEDITDKDKVFLSAQEVQKILPEAVSEDVDGFLQLSYIDLVPLLISAVKDLTKEIETLKIKIGE